MYLHRLIKLILHCTFLRGFVHSQQLCAEEVVHASLLVIIVMSCNCIPAIRTVAAPTSF